MVSPWSIELEPEVERCLESLPAGQFATVATRIEYLAERGAAIRMPRSRSLGEGLFELRFDLAQKAQRITCDNDMPGYLADSERMANAVAAAGGSAEPFLVISADHFESTRTLIAPDGDVARATSRMMGIGG